MSAILIEIGGSQVWQQDSHGRQLGTTGWPMRFLCGGASPTPRRYTIIYESRPRQATTFYRIRLVHGGVDVRPLGGPHPDSIPAH